MKWYEKQRSLYEKSKMLKQTVTDGEENEEITEVAFMEDVEEPLFAENLESANVISDIETITQTVTKSEVTVIAAGTLIRGDFESAGDLQFRGEIHGNIICHGYLELYGSVEGDITCRDAYINNSEMVGNVNCEEKLCIMNHSSVTGNLQSKVIECFGEVRGNVTASQCVQLMRPGMITGDIQTVNLEIERGAWMQGNVHMEQS